MGQTSGIGSISFGSNVLAFLASDGINEGGAAVPEVNFTADGDTDAKYIPGDVIDHSDFTVTVIADDTVDVEGLVGTSETTVITYPLAAGGVGAKTKTGTAFMKSAARNSAENTLNTLAVVFHWEAAPTTAVAT